MKESVYKSNSLKGWLLFISFIISLIPAIRLFTLAVRGLYIENELNIWIIVLCNLLLLLLILFLFYYSRCTTIILTGEGIIGINFFKKLSVPWTNIHKLESQVGLFGKIFIVKSHQGGSLLGNIVFDTSIYNWQDLEQEIKKRMEENLVASILA